MRISDWSSDVCSSDLSAKAGGHIRRGQEAACRSHGGRPASCLSARTGIGGRRKSGTVRVSVARHFRILRASGAPARGPYPVLAPEPVDGARSEEHTSELQSLMRISYAVFCLKKKNISHTLAL